MISISRLVILTSLPFFYLFLFCIVRIRRTRTFTVFPFLSLLQIPVLQMISLYRSSPRRVKSIFSSCVCAQRTSFCPSHNSKYKKTARIIFWRPSGYEAISALFPFFHYDKTGFLQALRQRWFVLDCPFSFALCTIISVCRSHNFVHISQYITLFRENIRETHGKSNVHCGRIFLHHIHLTADISGGLLDR